MGAWLSLVLAMLGPHQLTSQIKLVSMPPVIQKLRRTRGQLAYSLPDNYMLNNEGTDPWSLNSLTERGPWESTWALLPAASESTSWSLFSNQSTHAFLTAWNIKWWMCHVAGWLRMKWGHSGMSEFTWLGSPPPQGRSPGAQGVGCSPFWGPVNRGCFGKEIDVFLA